ncbi:MAG: sensor histidine kinase, partial [Maritimibacter sp.]
MQRYIRPLWILVWLALTITTGAGVWHWSYRAALDGLAERGRADLSLASDRLTAQLFRYRELAVVLARHPLMEGALDGSAYWRDVRSYVLSMADMTGADSIEVVAPSGAIVVALRGATFRPDPAALPLSRALTGSLGTAHAIGTASDGTPRRVFAFAAPVFDEASRVLGAVMVEIDVSGIEENWPGAAPAVIFSDDTGMVFVSNRSDLVMTNRSTGAGFPAYTAAQTGPHQIWTLNGGPYLPRRALHLARALPVIGMQAELLVDTASAERSALLQAAVAAGFLLVFGGVLLVISENRRA